MIRLGQCPKENVFFVLMSSLMKRIHPHHHRVIYIYFFIWSESKCYGEIPPPSKGKLNIFPTKGRVRKKYSCADKDIKKKVEVL